MSLNSLDSKWTELTAPTIGYTTAFMHIYVLVGSIIKRVKIFFLAFFFLTSKHHYKSVYLYH